MKATFDDNIRYPEDADVALALDIQVLAEDADQALFDLYSQLLDDADVPAYIATTAGILVVPGPGTYVTYTPSVVEYASSGSMSGFTIGNPADAGWYKIGAFCTATPVGAVTANSYRELQIQVNNPNVVTPGTTLYHMREYDSGGPDTSLLMELTAYLPAGASLQNAFGHGNVAPGVQVNAAARMWMHRICPAVT